MREIGKMEKNTGTAFILSATATYMRGSGSTISNMARAQSAILLAQCYSVNFAETV
jgi:hypothetical protein